MEQDALLNNVIEFFTISEEKITISLTQRKFKLGYNRANLIIKQMYDKLKESRELLVSEYIGTIDKPMCYYDKRYIIAISRNRKP